MKCAITILIHVNMKYKLIFIPVSTCIYLDADLLFKILNSLMWLQI